MQPSPDSEKIQLSAQGKALHNYLTMLAEDTDKKIDEEIEEYKKELEEASKEREGAIKAFKRDKLFPYLIGLFYIITFFHLFRTIIQYGQCILFVDVAYLNYSSTYMIFWILTPLIIFLLSTKYKIWNFHIRKYIILWISILSLACELTKIIYLLCFGVFVPIISKMPMVRGLSASMMLYLMRMTLLLFSVSFFIWIISMIVSLVNDRYTKLIIEGFRVENYINKSAFGIFDKYSYDVKSIWRMTNGFRFGIQEKDRFLHTLVDGVTGTGKSSSMLIPMIVDDLDTKVRNEDTQKKKAFEAVINGHIVMKEPFEDKDFDLDKFEACEGHEKILEELKKKYRSAGATIVAPDASLTDKVYKFCQKRKVHCNRIDPEFDEETQQKKPGRCGFNPLYLSPDTLPQRYHTVVVQKATLFADVLQAIADMGGSSEQYFASINRNIITAFVIMLELTYTKVHPGKLPTPEDVQLLVNNFDRVKPYYDVLCANEDHRKRYTFVIDFIAYDILGAGKKDMLNQSRGLKNMLNELLANPSVKEILCTQNSIDLDKMLSEGQITVFNYSQEMGDRDATALGLFFTLSFNNAVLRRPGTEDTRIPHFYIIDELPVLLHPQFEKCVTLFRKFRVASTFAIQTHDQMDKNDMTRYLRGILVGNCSHQIVYGRINTTEMELYQELAGTEAVESEQKSDSQTAITSSSPTFSYGSRTSIVEENIMSGAEMRNRGFQEVTVFSVRNGNTIKPFHGRLSFVEYAKTRKIKRYSVDWQTLYNDYCIDEERVDGTTLLFSSGAEARAVALETKGTIKISADECIVEDEIQLEVNKFEDEKLSSPNISESNNDDILEFELKLEDY